MKNFSAVCWLAAGLAAPVLAQSASPESVILLHLQHALRQAGFQGTVTQLKIVTPVQFDRRCETGWQVSGTRQLPASVQTLALTCARPVRLQRVTVKAQLQVQVAVAARRIAAGSRLQADDIVWETRSLTQLADLVGDPQELLGRSNRSALSPGDVLYRRQLQAEVLIKRQDPVKIVARQGDIELIARGVALTNGVAGETIRVRNNSSGKVLHARVRAAGEVELLE